jgi:hypothetical protein
LREAIAVSDILHAEGVSDPTDRKLLASVRAGTLLDLFDHDGDRNWVTLAEQAVSIVMALGPRDDEAWALSRRLAAARRRLGLES